MFRPVLLWTLLLSASDAADSRRGDCRSYEETAASVFRTAESSTLQTESVSPTESMSLAYKATRCHIQEDGIPLGCSQFLILPTEQDGVAMTLWFYSSQILAGTLTTLSKGFCGFYQPHTSNIGIFHPLGYHQLLINNFTSPTKFLHLHVIKQAVNQTTLCMYRCI